MADLKIRLSKREIEALKELLTEKSQKDVFDHIKKQEYFVLLDKIELFLVLFDIDPTLFGVVLKVQIPETQDDCPSL